MIDRNRLTNGGFTWLAVLLIAVAGFFGFATPVTLHAQTTAMISGTVQDQTGGVIPNASVTLTNIATGDARTVQSNEAGVYAFPSLVPAIYNIEAKAKGFKVKLVTGIELHAGESRTVPALTLEVGTESETVTVSAASEMIPVENGQRNVVLNSKAIENIANVTRDTTALVTILPGATTMSAGLTDNSPMYSGAVTHVQQSSVGMGVNISGAIYRGGTSLLSDGANIIDVGNMGASLSVVNPNMTAEVSVQASNFGADVPFGPVVISTISKSGSSDYHGEAYFNARNSVLNANNWQDNHQGVPLGPQHYYYPGGDMGGPVPGTNKKLMFWGGYERWLQNQGNANVLRSFIPSAAMMSGNFSMDDAENAKLCPHGFFQGNPPSGYGGGPWCSDLGGTILANGTTTATLPELAATGTYAVGDKTYQTDAGQKFPAGFLDPGSAALAKIWPKANADPSITPGGYNYYQPIENIDNGWIYRVRLDYLLGENTKIYGSYQQAYDSGLAQGNGAHLYWTPGNAIPFPGGGVTQRQYGKSMSGHIVHNFNETTTNDFMAAWAFGSFPFTTPTPSAAYKSTLGYNYGSVFGTTALNIPAYSSAGNQTFPDFSQASIFENPPGQYGVRKEAPQFADTFTKVWGKHTLKLGAFTQTTDNWQSTFGSYMDGNLNFAAGQNPDVYYDGKNNPVNNGLIGSPFNATANFVAGIASNYSENNSAPIADLAYMSTAVFVDDTWKLKPNLTVELGMRMEHVGHWYDRNRIGMPVFYKDRVMGDYYAGKYAPGFYWHAIDAGVPLSGQPNRFVYPDARFGMAYDVFGSGKTVVRGGWGVYRYVTQTNTPGGALTTSQHMLSYNLPGQSRIQLQNLGNLKFVPCPSATKAPPCGTSGNLTGLDPTDPGQPMTQAYSLTVDQRMPWNSLLEVAYVGSQTSQLSTNGQDLQGSNFGEFANQNKTPIGAFRQPDPVTGKTSTNPENLGQQLDGSTIDNKRADYHPFGLAYGTSSVYMMQNVSYANYNGLQVSWTKTTGQLTYNFNTTWSKALGTGMQTNPYDINLNYGPLNIDRPWVFNGVYTYDSGTLHTGSQILNQVLGGWIINGTSTWQAGGYIPTALGNQVPNFSMGLQYTGLPSDAAANGITTNLGAPTYFGTDATYPILPVLTCNPTSGLANNQLLNGKCFSAPAVGSQGGQKFPYMRAMAYFNNDLAIARSFKLHESHQVELRASAFNWLNHPLPQFSSLTPLTINYNVDYNSKQITPNFNQGSTGTNAFGVTDTKSKNYSRVIELSVRYSF